MTAAPVQPPLLDILRAMIPARTGPGVVPCTKAATPA